MSSKYARGYKSKFMEDNLMEYRGISKAEHSRVLHEIKIDRQALIDFYNMFPRDTFIWNEFKKNTINNPK